MSTKSILYAGFFGGALLLAPAASHADPRVSLSLNVGAPVHGHAVRHGSWDRAYDVVPRYHRHSDYGRVYADSYDLGYDHRALRGHHGYDRHYGDVRRSSRHHDGFQRGHGYDREIYGSRHHDREYRRHHHDD